MFLEWKKKTAYQIWFTYQRGGRKRKENSWADWFTMKEFWISNLNLPGSKKGNNIKSQLFASESHSKHWTVWLPNFAGGWDVTLVGLVLGQKEWSNFKGIYTLRWLTKRQNTYGHLKSSRPNLDKDAECILKCILKTLNKRAGDRTQWWDICLVNKRPWV